MFVQNKRFNNVVWYIYIFIILFSIPKIILCKINEEVSVLRLQLVLKSHVTHTP